MTPQAILQKAINKAIENGWDILQQYEAPDWWVADFPAGKLNPGDTVQPHMHIGKQGHYVNMVLSPRMVLLDHDFAKALWGDKNPEGYMLHVRGETLATEYIDGSWQYHLQQMVIADDAIAHLGEHLDA
jgi:hypothetical protein